MAMDCDLNNLLNETRAAVKACDESYREIAEHSGLSRWWIAKFVQGEIPNPGVENLVKLRNYLTKAA